jgi:hypothetical protein
MWRPFKCGVIGRGDRLVQRKHVLSVERSRQGLARYPAERNQRVLAALISQAITQIFPVPTMDNTFLHLGHPLMLPAKDRKSAYNFVLDKFKSKLSSYKVTHFPCCKT